MLKWTSNRTTGHQRAGQRADDSCEEVYERESSDSGSDISPSNIRLLRLSQDYENYRRQLLSDLENLTQQAINEPDLPNTANGDQDNFDNECRLGSSSIKKREATPAPDKGRLSVFSEIDRQLNEAQQTVAKLSVESVVNTDMNGGATHIHSANAVAENNNTEIKGITPKAVEGMNEKVKADNEEAAVKSTSCRSLSRPPRSERDGQCNTGVASPSNDVTHANLSRNSGSSSSLNEVLDIINSLKTQFHELKSQLANSAKSQQELVEEIDCLKKERITLVDSLLDKPSLSRFPSSSMSEASNTDSLLRSNYRRPLPSLPSVNMAVDRLDSATDTDGNTSLSEADNHNAHKVKRVSVRTRTDRGNSSSRTNTQGRAANCYDSDSSCSLVARDPDFSHYQNIEGHTTSFHKKPLTAKDANEDRKQQVHRTNSASMFDLNEEASRTDGRGDMHSPQQVDRLRILHELTESERLYCNNLWQLTHNYSRLFYSTGAITKRDISRVFPPNIFTMYHSHCAMLKSLNKKMSLWLHDTNSFGDVFVRLVQKKKVDLLSVYKDYIEKFPHIVRIINKLTNSSPLFRKVLRKSHTEGGAIGSSQEMIDILMLPIRRFSVYISFIKEMIYLSSIELGNKHPDVLSLQASAETLKKFVRAMSKSIDTCIQLSGVHIAPANTGRAPVAQDISRRPPSSPVRISHRGYHTDIQLHDGVSVNGRQHLNEDSGIDSPADFTAAHRQHSARVPPPSHYQLGSSQESVVGASDSTLTNRVAQGNHPLDGRFRTFKPHSSKSRVQEEATPTNVGVSNNKMHRGADSTARYSDNRLQKGVAPQPSDQSELLTRLNHSLPHNIRGVGGGDIREDSRHDPTHVPMSPRSRVRFQTPVAESSHSLTRSTSQAIANNRRTITDTFKVMFSKK